MRNMVDRAFLFALKVHGGQTRKDGKPYITHPFLVAMELAKNGANDELICAGLLHDTIEDGGVTPEELKREFSEEVLRLFCLTLRTKSFPGSNARTQLYLHLRTATANAPCSFVPISSPISAIWQKGLKMKENRSGTNSNMAETGRNGCSVSMSKYSAACPI